MTDERFYQLCRANLEVKFERDAQEERSRSPGTDKSCISMIVGSVLVQQIYYAVDRSL